LSPTVFIYGKYRFYFNSREESRMHVHIQSPAWIGQVLAGTACCTGRKLWFKAIGIKRNSKGN